MARICSAQHVHGIEHLLRQLEHCQSASAPSATQRHSRHWLWRPRRFHVCLQSLRCVAQGISVVGYGSQAVSRSAFRTSDAKHTASHGSTWRQFPSFLLHATSSSGGLARPSTPMWLKAAVPDHRCKQNCELWETLLSQNGDRTYIARPPAQSVSDRPMSVRYFVPPRQS